jgi:hypothetical protein
MTKGEGVESRVVGPGNRYIPPPGGLVCVGMIGVRGSLQSAVDRQQLKREEPERKSEEGLTAETLSTQRSERRDGRESDFTAEDTEGTEIAEPESESEWGRGKGMRGLRGEPFDRLRGDILRRMSRASGGFFEGGVEFAVFGVVGEVEGFEEGVGEVVGVLAGLLAAFGG